MWGYVTTPLTDMRVLLLAAVMAVAAAEPNCDPQTQYALGDRCCKMCGPGTSMANSNCDQPICQPCGENEYQDKYTIEPRCHRQPYCDQNLNFETPKHDSKIQTVCRCKKGFHCTRGDCSGCVPHTNCKEGEGAKMIGNQTHDTVCEDCPAGKYSDEISWSAPCREHTECLDGYRLEKEGTAASDNICIKDRKHDILIGVGSTFGLTVVGAIIACLLCRDKRGGKSQNFKDCVESCMGPKREQLREERGPMINPTTNTVCPQEEELSAPEMESKPEDSFQRTPEENEDQQGHGTSDNGNVVTQENGKAEVLSRQESQTQSFTE